MVVWIARVGLGLDLAGRPLTRKKRLELFQRTRNTRNTRNMVSVDLQETLNLPRFLRGHGLSWHVPGCSWLFLVFLVFLVGTGVSQRLFFAGLRRGLEIRSAGVSACRSRG